jgi:hypothetical protein
MSTYQNTSIDPRERLMIVGNKILDATYELDKTEALVKAITAVKDDRDTLSLLMKEEGATKAMISSITLSFERAALTREYIILRSTIESLAGGARPEVSL